MNNRNRVLERIRKNLNNADSDPVARRREHQSLEKINASLRPRLKNQDLLECLIERMESVQITIDTVEQNAAITDAIVQYLQTHDLLLAQTRVSPGLDYLNLPTSIPSKIGSADKNTVVSISPCLAAIAETGSLIFESSATMPTSLLFLPEHHIVILEEEKVVAHMEDVWQLLSAQNEQPRVVHCNTGPSRTADIELILELGAHGPRAMHVIIVGTH